jgi:hypothetical protein
MGANLVSIAQASGILEAEIMRGMLAAHGIEAWLSSEAAASVYGLGVGPMAVVHLLVREDDQHAAEQVVHEYYSGDLSLED